MELRLVELVECLDDLACPVSYCCDHAIGPSTWVRHGSIFPPTLRPIGGKKRPPGRSGGPGAQAAEPTLDGTAAAGTLCDRSVTFQSAAGAGGLPVPW